jgi:acetylornithine deacetylase/succinyl-diaminopimelate desuccinylase-like protein
MMVSTDEMTAPTAALVAIASIDSTNPDLVPGSAGGARIVCFIADWLEQAGLEVEWHELALSRANVIAIACGSSDGRGKSLMLNAHMDVVSAGGMIEP